MHKKIEHKKIEQSFKAELLQLTLNNVLPYIKRLGTCAYQYMRLHYRRAWLFF